MTSLSLPEADLILLMENTRDTRADGGISMPAYSQGAVSPHDTSISETTLFQGFCSLW